jgi:cytochrome c5
MSDREFLKLFSGLIGALVALTIVLFIIANSVAGKKAPQAPDAKAVAERIKPVGDVAIGPSSGINLIATANAAGEDKGKAVYDASCAACHGAGIAGAPKFGEKAAWKDRIVQGDAKLYEHALKGFQGKLGFMPPKGGNTALPDADVKAAVDYMVSKAK